MSKCIASLLAAVALLLFAAPLSAAPKEGKPTPEEQFKKLDKNADGKVSLDEFKGKKTGEKAEHAEEIFKAKDKDGDGFLTMEEFTAKVKKNKTK